MEHNFKHIRKLGSFWEGFSLEEVIRLLQASDEECYFWSTQADAELDLLIIKNGKRLGFEFKYADAPKVTKSMHIAHCSFRFTTESPYSHLSGSAYISSVANNNLCRI